MIKPFIIFLAFVSFAQSAYVPSLLNDFGLSDEDAIVLNQIIVNQEVTVNTYLGGIVPIFDVLFNLEAEANSNYSTVEEALVKVKAAIDLDFDSEVLVLGRSCSAVENARNVTHVYLDDIFGRIESTLRLARLGNYYENRAAIEIHRGAIRENYVNLVESDYDSINLCLNTTDAPTLTESENARNGSRESLIYLTNAIFNGIKVLASAGSTSCGDKSVTLDVEEYRDQAMNRIKNNVEYKFGLLRALYIESRINESGIISDLAKNQHGLSVSFNKYRRAYESMYGILIYYLRRIELGIDGEGDDEFTRRDASVAEVNVRFAYVGTLTLDAIPLINEQFAAILAILREELNDMSVEGDNAFLDVIDAVVGHKSENFSEILETVDHFREIAVSVYEPSNVLIFTFIRNNLTWSDEVDTKLKNLQAQANEASSAATYIFFEAVEILASCKFDGFLCEENYTSVQEIIDKTHSQLDLLLQSLFAAGFYVLQEHSANPNTQADSGGESIIFGQSSVFRVVCIQVITSIMMYIYN